MFDDINQDLHYIPVFNESILKSIREKIWISRRKEDFQKIHCKQKASKKSFQNKGIMKRVVSKKKPRKIIQKKTRN